ncbi:putative protein OS=Tsukamurella paurometabola (strain ATCC 8368 / DSM / CCUG 35730 /CIP 100753 / JCM 10117 / KCTC 9821 / NBRC 16120 / NCIMB 702349/ NCTC 13040) OX=521096 GN=Tpau_4095 PE=4 SV=1 [Tsukamurella paurometabola]|uniref:Uncharacterized protein n=1 Tax=Tsukamurella paurometabola (strain ATCC 8368 / DSM 20162 / CCUG 35730 / CIP 100753 / JCM 10117 / KCTC 9821 / NBRC 16120 / NCIMB 702349 / NCTC 13040) TaxID=521096 RepID=D5UNG9_TSUPD|nr:hypothetical protein [Tsukamurella paurometabola]ADG80664.1 conserved hypothetical protein [Tsukamurella paurometabola DSM 20162]SUP40486.1 Uncharacterised protein [Tsukamurella paurometabola]
MTDDLGSRLLDAQVEFAKKQLRDTAYHALVIDEVDHALAEASRLTLAEAVTPDMIKAVAAKYAVQVPVEGAIPELVGEIAGRLYRHSANEDTSLADVVDSRRFDELLTAVLEMEVTQRVLQQLWESPVTADTVTSVLHVAATSAADDAARALERNPLTRTVAGAANRVFGKALPVIGEQADEAARRGVRAVLRRATVDGDRSVAEAVRDVWRRNRENPLAAYRDMVTDADIEDVVVLIFEFWRTFRDTEYFRALLDEGIDHVFDKYGDTSLYELLAELGVGREDMIEEALRFGPPVIATLDERGVLDALLRRRLAPFFESDEYRAAMENRS